MDKIDITEKYETVNGLEVRLFSVRESDHGFIVTGQYLKKDGAAIDASWAIYGKIIHPQLGDDFDLKKVPYVNMREKYRTRDGYDVEILKILDNRQHKPVVGIKYHSNESSYATNWALDGFHEDSKEECYNDLIRVDK